MDGTGFSRFALGFEIGVPFQTDSSEIDWWFFFTHFDHSSLSSRWAGWKKDSIRSIWCRARGDGWRQKKRCEKKHERKTKMKEWLSNRTLALVRSSIGALVSLIFRRSGGQGWRFFTSTLSVHRTRSRFRFHRFSISETGTRTRMTKRRTSKTIPLKRRPFLPLSVAPFHSMPSHQSQQVRLGLGWVRLC